MTQETVREATHEARLEAAPFVVVAALALIALALVSRSEDWLLFKNADWWIWLIAAVPYLALALVLLAGLGRGVMARTRREVVSCLLAIIVILSVAETGLLIASLVHSTHLGITGPQLLMSAFALWTANVIAFGLAFWELDCGGPVSRALADIRSRPDFQFPQDENPDLAQPGWAPHLVDYLYLSITNSIAFSPTDVMPLSRPAKALMAVESAVSIMAILFVAARAVNILH